MTCGSPDCIRENKSRKHAGITYKWSDEAKSRVPKVQNENLKKGTYAAQQSPITGRFETNRNAKKWILIDPDGKEHHCQNLMEWARNNCELFGKEPCDHSAIQISSGFKAIASSLRGTRKNLRPVATYFGWTLKDIPKDQDK